MTYFEINNLDIVISCHCDHRMINVVSNYGNIDNIAVDPLSKQEKNNKIIKASINKVNSETELYTKVRN